MQRNECRSQEGSLKANVECEDCTGNELLSAGRLSVGVGASGAPFAQRKGGLHWQVLQSSLQCARATAAHFDLVGFDRRLLAMNKKLHCIIALFENLTGQGSSCSVAHTAGIILFGLV